MNFLADLQIWGTPDQVYEQMMEHQRMVDSGAAIGIFSFGGMPQELAKANLELFAKDVLPRLQAHPVGEPIGGVGRPLSIVAA